MSPLFSQAISFTLTSKQMQHSSWPESGRHLWFPSRRLSKHTLQTSQWNDLSWWILDWNKMGKNWLSHMVLIQFTPKRKMLSPRKEKLGNLLLEINIITINISLFSYYFSFRKFATYFQMYLKTMRLLIVKTWKDPINCYFHYIMRRGKTFLSWKRKS